MSVMWLLSLLLVPLVTAAVGALGGAARTKDAVFVVGMALTFALSLATANQFLGGVRLAAFGDVLLVDGLSALVVALCGFIGLLASLYGVAYLRRNAARGLVTPRMRREFHALVPAYVFAMLLIAIANNLGIMWIAVELTTLASVFLVAFHNRDTSLEAAWKFLMLGSLGLGFALLGTVLLFASAHGRLGEDLSALHWTRFIAIASELDPFTLRLAVVFALIGYGTKAGLAPMHTWKPDAYREAPSPIGLLMAAGMVNAALYCVIRIHLISKAAMGPDFSSAVLLVLGVLSVLIAVPFVLIQWNLKRLLAYSSIEHAGIIVIGIAVDSPAAVFAALLHMTYHSVMKPVAFFSAGTLAQLHRSSDFAGIGRATLATTPVASALLLLAAVMVTGSPPFGMFFSELAILQAGFASSHQTAVALLLAALVVLFCGFAFQVGRLVLGPQQAPSEHPPDPEVIDLGAVTTLAAAGVAVALSFYLPDSFLMLIRAAASVIGAGR
jgi:hydrogenase-4 component F